MTNSIPTALNQAAALPPLPLTVLTLTAVAIALGTARLAVVVGRHLAAMDKTRRGDLAELALVAFFAVVVGGLIMQGLIGFARDDMGLAGPWPYLLFAALDGMAAFFAVITYRWTAQGASATGPRLMVFGIVAGSSWFQWSHAEGLTLAAQVAWAVMPLIAAVLWETILITRRRAWKQKQPTTGSPIPAARWMWDPLGSAAIARRMHLWNVTDWQAALELHMMRTEAIRRLRRAFGARWARKVPADVAVRLKKGFKIPEAAVRVDAIITGEDTPAPVETPVPAAVAAVDAWHQEPEDTADADDAPVEPWEEDAESRRFFEIITQPSQPEPPKPARQRHPRPGDAEFEEIVRLYQASVDAGEPMSGRDICHKAGIGYWYPAFATKVKEHAEAPALFTTADAA